MTRLLGAVLYGVLCAGAVQADTLADRLIARYERVETMTCDVRRDIANEDGRMRWLSRVHYQRPDRLHVENHAPLPRRIIADGKTMYQQNDGQRRGFRRPITELDEAMVFGLRKVPGTAMEHLFRLQGIPETEWDGDGAYPIRRGYQAERIYVVLHADDEYRLGRVEIFSSADQEVMTGEIDFEAFEEVLDGVWIPLLHQGHFRFDAFESRETTRISNVSVNEPIPEHLFNAGAFFKDVQWVDRFEDL